MTDDLEKRLLRVGERVPVPCPDGIKGCLVAHYRIETDPVCREAAATIAAQKAEIERLTRALRSIAWPMNEAGPWAQAVAASALPDTKADSDGDDGA